MRTIYAALAITLALFFTGKLPMQHARNVPNLSVVTPAVAGTEAAVEKPVPLIRYVTARTCASRGLFGSTNCKDVMSVVVR